MHCGLPLTGCTGLRNHPLNGIGLNCHLIQIPHNTILTFYNASTSYWLATNAEPLQPFGLHPLARTKSSRIISQKIATSWLPPFYSRPLCVIRRTDEVTWIKLEPSCRSLTQEDRQQFFIVAESGQFNPTPYFRPEMLGKSYMYSYE